MSDLLLLIDDLKEQIFMSLPCKYLVALSITCKDLQKFINDKDLINKRKYLGFPRKDGHCAVHSIANIMQNILRISDDEFYSLRFTSKINLRIVLDSILEELLRNSTDLVRGDIIDNSPIIKCVDLIIGEFMSQEYIREKEGKYKCFFDGYKIITTVQNTNDNINEYLSDHQPYGSIPPEFTVINNDLPIKYWGHILDNNIMIRKGFDYDTFVWFDVDTEIRNQLLENIKKEKLTHLKDHKLNSKSIVYTHFILNGKTYYIIASEEDRSNIDLDYFRNNLSIKSKLLLEYGDVYSVFSKTDTIPDNILFWSANFNCDGNFVI
jgi:hypothetical protein